MSVNAIMGATRDTVQALLGLTPGTDAAAAVCDMTSDGQPKPVSGQIFYGLIASGFDNASYQCLDESYRCDIIITLRADYCPADRVGTELLHKLKSGTNTGGLWARVDELRALLHLNYSVLDKAGGSYGAAAWTGGHAYSLAATVNGFEQPWRFARVEYLGAKGPDWFWAEGQDQAITGVAAKLSFDFARRIQTIESET